MGVGCYVSMQNHYADVLSFLDCSGNFSRNLPGNTLNLRYSAMVRNYGRQLILVRTILSVYVPLSFTLAEEGAPIETSDMDKTKRIRLNLDLRLLENLPEVVPDDGFEPDPRIVALVRALARQAAEKHFSELQIEDEKEYDKSHTRRR